MKCVFCGKEIKSGWGNSCRPIYNDEKIRCCNGCNYYVVIPARIEQIKEEAKKDELSKTNKDE